jgi:hypothetical protein
MMMTAIFSLLIYISFNAKTFFNQPHGYSNICESPKTQINEKYSKIALSRKGKHEF